MNKRTGTVPVTLQSRHKSTGLNRLVYITSSGLNGRWRGFNFTLMFRVKACV